MDPFVTFLVGTASGLIVGLVLGWFGHVLASRRSKDERRAVDELQTIDRCIELFGLQIKYVIATDTPTADRKAAQAAYYDLYWGRYWYARPEVILAGTEEWLHYKEAERQGRDKTVPVTERINAIKTSSKAVLDLLIARRANLLK